MCELFGMNASQAVTAGTALERLRQRGGREADNPDGWTAFAPGELRVYRHGRMAGRATTRGQPPRQQQ